jgi:hypothetical protein
MRTSCPCTRCEPRQPASPSRRSCGRGWLRPATPASSSGSGSPTAASAAALVDGAYDELYRYLRAGIRENSCVALVSRYLYENGSEEVGAINSISGERCSPPQSRVVDPGSPLMEPLGLFYRVRRQVLVACRRRVRGRADGRRPHAGDRLGTLARHLNEHDLETLGTITGKLLGQLAAEHELHCLPATR